MRAYGRTEHRDGKCIHPTCGREGEWHIITKGGRSVLICELHYLEGLYYVTNIAVSHPRRFECTEPDSIVVETTQNWTACVLRNPLDEV